MTKNTWIVVAILVGGCQPDTSEAEDVCTQVVKDGLDECTEKAWELCDKSYQQVMDDLRAENERLYKDIAALANGCQAACAGTCDGYSLTKLNDFMLEQQCVYVYQPTRRWVCNEGPLCEPSP